ncbi:ubiquitin-protein ligase E3A-like [Amphibalanus amphitrite]|uniref:ubiquitin-protein ligase E3A-like n=1 Tax=Amphibalanus amphitrite TaxID=1232801 RepID=UPI001C903110|nr:ubiquitin-protein ligase E3A-like [Amphibalanus amphitrite]
MPGPFPFRRPALGPARPAMPCRPEEPPWSAEQLIHVVERSARAHDYSHVIRAIGRIFSDVHVLKRSFLRPRGSPISDGPAPRLDLEGVRPVFSLLFSTGDSPFTAALAAALCRLSDGLCASLAARQHGWRRDPALLHVVALVLEIPALGSSEFLTLALPGLCRAAALLPAAAQARLVRLWARCPPARLRHMVHTLQQLISVRVVEAGAHGQVTDDPVLEAAVRLLGLLYRASLSGGRRDPPPPPAPGAAPAAVSEVEVRPSDCRVPLVSWEEFHNEPLSEAVEFDHDFRLYQEHPDRFCLLRHPFALTPAARALALFYMSRVRMYREGRQAVLRAPSLGPAALPHLPLRVRRQWLVQDALCQLETVARDSPESLKKQLVVQFIGEQGVDEGGLSKEFFRLIVERLFSAEYGLFTYSEETRCHWFRPGGGPPERDAQYSLAGLILGLAIYNSVTLDVRLPAVAYRKLAGRRGALEDLEQLSPTLHRSLSAMLEYTGNDLEEVFVQTFQVGYTDGTGAQRSYELVPGGRHHTVGRHNVRDFADRYADFLLNKSVRRAFRAFRRGFQLVTDETPLWSLFRAEEAELLLCGSQEYDFSQLEAAAEYDGYTRDTPVVRHFWRVVRQLTEEQRRRLLEFITGSDRAPVGGLRQLRLVVTRQGPDSDRLPSAHTCFNVLLLPEYRSISKLRRMLLKAIDYSQGFGLV